MSKSRLLAAVALVATGAFGVGMAQAQESQVSWSITVGSPLPVLPVPVFIRPAPVVVQPAPHYGYEHGYGATSIRRAGTAMAMASRIATTASTTRRGIVMAMAFRTTTITSTTAAMTATVTASRIATIATERAGRQTKTPLAGRFFLNAQSSYRVSVRDRRLSIPALRRLCDGADDVAIDPQSERLCCRGARAVRMRQHELGTLSRQPR